MQRDRRRLQRLRQLRIAGGVSALNSGKYVSAAIRQPARMIGLRPMRSESAPNIRKNGVPMISAMAISRFACAESIFSACVRKNSA